MSGRSQSIGSSTATIDPDDSISDPGRTKPCPLFDYFDVQGDTLTEAEIYKRTQQYAYPELLQQALSSHPAERDGLYISRIVRYRSTQEEFSTHEYIICTVDAGRVTRSRSRRSKSQAQTRAELESDTVVENESQHQQATEFYMRIERGSHVRTGKTVDVITVSPGGIADLVKHDTILSELQFSNPSDFALGHFVDLVTDVCRASRLSNRNNSTPKSKANSNSQPRPPSNSWIVARAILYACYATYPTIQLYVHHRLYNYDPVSLFRGTAEELRRLLLELDKEKKKHKRTWSLNTILRGMGDDPVGEFDAMIKAAIDKPKDQVSGTLSSLPSELNLHSRNSSQDYGNRFDFHPYDLDQLKIAEEKQRAIQFHQFLRGSLSVTREDEGNETKHIESESDSHHTHYSSVSSILQNKLIYADAQALLDDLDRHPEERDQLTVTGLSWYHHVDRTEDKEYLLAHIRQECPSDEFKLRIERETEGPGEHYVVTMYHIDDTFSDAAQYNLGGVVIPFEYVRIDDYLDLVMEQEEHIYGDHPWLFGPALFCSFASHADWIHCAFSTNPDPRDNGLSITLPKDPMRLFEAFHTFADLHKRRFVEDDEDVQRDYSMPDEVVTEIQWISDTVKKVIGQERYWVMDECRRYRSDMSDPYARDLEPSVAPSEEHYNAWIQCGKHKRIKRTRPDLEPRLS